MHFNICTKKNFNVPPGRSTPSRLTLAHQKSQREQKSERYSLSLHCFGILPQTRKSHPEKKNGPFRVCDVFIAPGAQPTSGGYVKPKLISPGYSVVGRHDRTFSGNCHEHVTMLSLPTYAPAVRWALLTISSSASRSQSATPLPRDQCIVSISRDHLARSPICQPRE